MCGSLPLTLNFDTLLMHVFDKRFRPPTLGCFLWALFVNFNGMIHVVTFWFGATLDCAPSCHSNLFVEFFCEGSHDSWKDSLLGIPLYLWDTIWRFIPITCIDLLSLMVPAREISGFLISLAVITLDLYPCGRPLDSFIFPAFYRFLSWKTSIGGNVFVCLLLCLKTSEERHQW